MVLAGVRMAIMATDLLAEDQQESARKALQTRERDKGCTPEVLLGDHLVEVGQQTEVSKRLLL